MNNLFLQNRAELATALRRFKFVRTPTGLYFPGSGLNVGGVFRTWVNGQNEQIDPNVVFFLGLDDILKVYFAQSAQRTAFYIAPFSTNVDPPQDLVAADFPGDMGEFVGYSQGGRVLWAKDAEASQAIANAATPALFTSTVIGSVRGAVMTTVQAKSATTGLLVCGSRFSASRDLQITDKLSVEYSIVAADGTPP